MDDLICLAAIDVREGRCVRLLRGDFAQQTTYGDPIEQAKRYVDEGATWLHVVDLDAARGSADNRELITALVSAVSVPVEVGGGVRDEKVAAQLLDTGAARVIVGTAAVEHPDLVAALCDAYPGRVGIGLDHRVVADARGTRREVSLRGWLEGSGRTVAEVLSRFETLALSAIVVTDISRDGTLSGADLAGYRELLSITKLPLVASGGVGSANDLAALAQLEVAGRRLLGAVVGKALLSGALSMQEALSACAR